MFSEGRDDLPPARIVNPSAPTKPLLPEADLDRRLWLNAGGNAQTRRLFWLFPWRAGAALRPKGLGQRGMRRFNRRWALGGGSSFFLNN
jgi:hypothetical protein